MIRITAPHFVAGLEHDHKRVMRAAPIIRYIKGWSLVKVKNYCDQKGWLYELLD